MKLKRVLSLALSLLIIFTAVPTNIFMALGGFVVAEASISFDSTDYDEVFNIYDAEDFYNLTESKYDGYSPWGFDGDRNDSNAKILFRLHNNISLDPDEFKNGDNLRTLNGVLQGNGHTITLEMSNDWGTSVNGRIDPDNENSSRRVTSIGLFHKIGENGAISDVNFKIGNGSFSYIYQNYYNISEVVRQSFVAATNYGTIQNCSLETSSGWYQYSSDINKYKTDDYYDFGMFVGYNKGTVQDCIVDGVGMSIGISAATAPVIEAHIGGVVGVNANGGEVVGCAIDNATINYTITLANNGFDYPYEPHAKVGGIVGKNETGGIIAKCVVDDRPNAITIRGNLIHKGYYVQPTSYFPSYGVSVTDGNKQFYMDILDDVRADAIANYVGNDTYGQVDNYPSSVATNYSPTTNDMYYASGSSIPTFAYDRDSSITPDYSSVQEMIDDPLTPFIDLSTNNIGLYWQSDEKLSASIVPEGDDYRVEAEIGEKMRLSDNVTIEVEYTEKGIISNQTLNNDIDFEITPKTLKSAAEIYVNFGDGSTPDWQTLEGKTIKAGVVYPIAVAVDGQNLSADDLTTPTWTVGHGIEVLNGTISVPTFTAHNTSVDISAAIGMTTPTSPAQTASASANFTVSNKATLDTDWKTQIAKSPSAVYIPTTAGLVWDNRDRVVTIELPEAAWSTNGEDPTFSWTADKDDSDGVTIANAQTREVTFTINPTKWNANETKFTATLNVTDGDGTQSTTVEIPVIKGVPTLEITTESITAVNFSSISQAAQTRTPTAKLTLKGYDITSLGTPTVTMTDGAGIATQSGGEISITPWFTTGTATKSIKLSAGFTYGGITTAVTDTATITVSVPQMKLGVYDNTSGTGTLTHLGVVGTAPGDKNLYVVATKAGAGSEDPYVVNSVTAWRVTPSASASITAAGLMSFTAPTAEGSVVYAITPTITLTNNKIALTGITEPLLVDGAIGNPNGTLTLTVATTRSQPTLPSGDQSQQAPPQGGTTDDSSSSTTPTTPPSGDNSSSTAPTGGDDSSSTAPQGSGDSSSTAPTGGDDSSSTAPTGDTSSSTPQGDIDSSSAATMSAGWGVIGELPASNLLFTGFDSTASNMIANSGDSEVGSGLVLLSGNTRATFPTGYGNTGKNGLYLNSDSSTQTYTVTLPQVSGSTNMYGYAVIDNIANIATNNALSSNGDGTYSINIDIDKGEPHSSVQTVKVSDGATFEILPTQYLAVCVYAPVLNVGETFYDYEASNTLIMDYTKTLHSTYSEGENGTKSPTTHTYTTTYTFDLANPPPQNLIFNDLLEADIRGTMEPDDERRTLVNGSEILVTVNDDGDETSSKYIISGPPVPPDISPKRVLGEDLTIDVGDRIEIASSQPNVKLLFAITETAAEAENLMENTNSIAGLDEFDNTLTETTNSDALIKDGGVVKLYIAENGIAQIPFFFDLNTMVITAWTVEVGANGETIENDYNKSDTVQETFTNSDRADARDAALYISNPNNNGTLVVDDKEYSREDMTLHIMDTNRLAFDDGYATVKYIVAETESGANNAEETSALDYDHVDGIDVRDPSWGLGLENDGNYNALEAIYVRVIATHTSSIYSVDQTLKVTFLKGLGNPVVNTIAVNPDDGSMDNLDTNLADGAYIAPKTKLVLEVNRADIDPQFLPDSNNEVTLPPSVTSYASNIPSIRYYITAPYTTGSIPSNVDEWEEVEDNSEIFTQATPTIHYQQDDGSVDTANARLAVPIEIDAIHGQSVTLYVKVNTPANASTENAGTVTQMTFNVQEALSLPEITINAADGTAIYPDPADPTIGLPSQLEVGNVVYLSSAAADGALASFSNIFYNLTGTEITTEMIEQAQIAYRESPSRIPDASDNKDLYLYNANSGIPVTYNAQSSFNLMAVITPSLTSGAVVKGATSYNLDFTRNVKALPPAETPASQPAGSTPAAISYVADNSSVTLTTGTSGAYIYYTVNNLTQSDLNPDQYEDLLAAGDMEALEAHPTKRIRSGESIQVETDANGNFSVFARAKQLEDANTTAAASATVRFDYQLEQSPAPRTNPSTVILPDDTDATVVVAGTQIRLITTKSNSVIYYTENGSDPVIPDVIGAFPTDIYTKLYDAENPPIMPENNYYITAIQVSLPSDTQLVYADSESVTFSFAAPAPVYSPTFSHPGGTVVFGTELKLSIGSQENTEIFYRIIEDGDTPDADDILTATNGQLYDSEEPIIIDRDMTVQAIGERDGTVSKVAEFTFELADQLDSPEPSLDSGSVVYSGYTLELDPDRSSRVAYTKDNSDPSDPDNDAVFYGTNVVISGEAGESVTIRAYSTEADYTPSEVATFTYTIVEEEELLRASPGTTEVVRNGTVVTLSTSITDGEIYYTTNGDDPLDDGRRGTTVTLDGTPGELISVKAAVTIDDNSNSDNGSVPVVFTYRLMSKSMTPSASIPSDAITLDGAQVALIAGEGANIYYTTDGTDPTTASSLYMGPISVSDSMILKSVASEADKELSDISTYFYSAAGDVIPPRSNTNSGEIEAGTQIILSSATDGAAIYYSTDGSTPNADSLDKLFRYETPITITRPVTIQMIAVKDGLNPSPVNSITYTVFSPPEPEEDSEDGQGFIATGTDRLESKRTFEEQTGPSFSDIVLQDTKTLSVISGNDGSIPVQAEFFIEELIPNEDDEISVKSVDSNYTIAGLFDVSLRTSEGEVQPDDEVEIGLPIPREYQNGIVVIAKINDDGSTEFLTTRRSSGMAYTFVDDLAKYAVTVPDEVSSSNMTPIVIGVLSAAAVLTASGTAMSLLRRRRRLDMGIMDDNSYEEMPPQNVSEGFGENIPMDDEENYPKM